MEEEKIYLFTGGRKHLGKKIKCRRCDKELIVSKYRSHCGYCQRCNCKRLSDTTEIKEDELFLIEAGAKRRAKKIKCFLCEGTLLVRRSSTQKMCASCNAKTARKRTNSDQSNRNNLRGYRKLALQYFKEVCQCCGKEGLVDIHHIDKDRKNNDIKNLLPLCKSCHMALHVGLKQGKNHDEAFRFVKREKLQKGV